MRNCLQTGYFIIILNSYPHYQHRLSYYHQSPLPHYQHHHHCRKKATLASPIELSEDTNIQMNMSLLVLILEVPLE
ncbi:unnamed protein product [Callosobruchus maculatus]|uniref:Uncharacterized protein n=1 Tax=Callosobruchus maculatus TaxID=64391 RepID=A0A653C5G0_CALMS|nr:unnamed protein product [Callosobruchus maculatus]